MATFEEKIGADGIQTFRLKDDKFLIGESVYLRLPNITADILNGSWHSWFNDLAITRFLTHGVFPINRESQANFISAEMAKPNTLILCVVHKESAKHLGVISLKNMDLVNRTAEIAIVMGPHKLPGAPALEAMALLVKHAFDRLNLEMLYAGQHESLWKWINQLRLIGFKIDGFRKNAGVRNRQPYGAFLTSVCADDFYRLQVARGGEIFAPSITELLAKRNRNNPLEECQRILDRLNKQSAPADKDDI